MLQRTGEAETITTHYLFALGAYRALYIPNWIYRYFFEVPRFFDPIAVIAGIIQTILYSDFFWIYYTKWVPTASRSSVMGMLTQKQGHPRQEVQSPRVGASGFRTCVLLRLSKLWVRHPLPAFLYHNYGSTGDLKPPEKSVWLWVYHGVLRGQTLELGCYRRMLLAFRGAIAIRSGASSSAKGGLDGYTMAYVPVLSICKCNASFRSLAPAFPHVSLPFRSLLMTRGHSFKYVLLTNSSV